MVGFCGTRHFACYGASLLSVSPCLSFVLFLASGVLLGNLNLIDKGPKMRDNAPIVSIDVYVQCVKSKQIKNNQYGPCLCYLD